jgi:hypothetical protein
VSPGACPASSTRTCPPVRTSSGSSAAPARRCRGGRCSRESAGCWPVRCCTALPHPSSLRFLVKQQLFFALLGLGLLAVPTAGQSRSQRDLEFKAPRRSQVPRELVPPPGMCRVWLENVPPSQQPAPTDCASAVRNRPPNARIIFPDTSQAAPPIPASRALQLRPRAVAPKDTG